MRLYVVMAKTIGDLVRLRRTVPLGDAGMRLYVVIAKTVGDLMGLRRVMALLAGGLAPAWFFSVVVWRDNFQGGNMSLEMETSELVGYFVPLSFLWIAGFYLAYMVVGTSGLGLVDREREKGTLLLMVSKPMSRTQFLLGKFLALVLTTLLLEAIILLGSVLLFWKLLGLDPDTVEALLELVPWMFLLSLLVTLVFASLSLLLSTLGGNDVVRSVAFMLILVTVFAAGPVMRGWWPHIYEEYRLYYLDVGYNLGNAYVLLLGQAETDRMTPKTQAWLGITTGTYKAGTEVLLAAFLGGEVLDPDIGAMPPSLERTTYLFPVVSIGLLLAVTVTAFGIANVALNRKEVQ